jgi:hypothetical protein
MIIRKNSGAETMKDIDDKRNVTKIMLKDDTCRTRNIRRFTIFVAYIVTHYVRKT